jgi:hypothetical protein
VQTLIHDLASNGRLATQQGIPRRQGLVANVDGVHAMLLTRNSSNGAGMPQLIYPLQFYLHCITHTSLPANEPKYISILHLVTLQSEEALGSERKASAAVQRKEVCPASEQRFSYLCAPVGDHQQAHQQQWSYHLIRKKVTSRCFAQLCTLANTEKPKMWAHAGLLAWSTELDITLSRALWARAVTTDPTIPHSRAVRQPT